MNKALKIALVLILGFQTISCNEDENGVKQENVVEKVSLISSKKLVNQNLINKINLKFSSKNKRLKKPNTNNALITEYNGTEIKSITIPLNNGIKYVTYSKSDLLSEVEMLIKVDEIGNNTYETKYYDMDMNIIGGLTVKDGIITEAFGIADSGNETQAYRGWGKKWAKCVGKNLNKMTDGSIEGSVYGLACIAFGTECAAGVAIGCAASATFS